MALARAVSICIHRLALCTRIFRAFLRFASRLSAFNITLSPEVGEHDVVVALKSLGHIARHVCSFVPPNAFCLGL